MAALPVPKPGKTFEKVLASDDLSALFGLEMDTPASAGPISLSGAKKKDRQPEPGPKAKRGTTQEPAPKGPPGKGSEQRIPRVFAPKKKAKAADKWPVVAAGPSGKKAKPATGGFVEVVISDLNGSAGRRRTISLPGSVRVEGTRKRASSAKTSMVPGKRKK